MKSASAGLFRAPFFMSENNPGDDLPEAVRNSLGSFHTESVGGDNNDLARVSPYAGTVGHFGTSGASLVRAKSERSRLLQRLSIADIATATKKPPFC